MEQQNVRSTAERAFMESLDQLQKTLQPADRPKPPDVKQTGSTVPPSLFDLGALEQAVADIEQFIEEKQKE